MLPDREEILKSAVFKTSRSGGKGGQNVNKVSTKVELIFNIETSEYFNDHEKILLKEKLRNRLDSDGLLHIVSQEDRSQLLNKEKTVVKLLALLRQSLIIPKKRKPTKVPKSIVLKRLKSKSATSELKHSRKKPNVD